MPIGCIRNGRRFDAEEKQALADGTVVGGRTAFMRGIYVHEDDEEFDNAPPDGIDISPQQVIAVLNNIKDDINALITTLYNLARFLHLLDEDASEYRRQIAAFIKETAIYYRAKTTREHQAFFTALASIIRQLVYLDKGPDEDYLTLLTVNDFLSMRDGIFIWYLHNKGGEINRSTLLSAMLCAFKPEDVNELVAWLTHQRYSEHINVAILHNTFLEYLQRNADDVKEETLNSLLGFYRGERVTVEQSQAFLLALTSLTSAELQAPIATILQEFLATSTHSITPELWREIETFYTRHGDDMAISINNHIQWLTTYAVRAEGVADAELSAIHEDLCYLIREHGDKITPENWGHISKLYSRESQGGIFTNNEQRNNFATAMASQLENINEESYAHIAPFLVVATEGFLYALITHLDPLPIIHSATLITRFCNLLMGGLNLDKTKCHEILKNYIEQNAPIPAPILQIIYQTYVHHLSEDHQKEFFTQTLPERARDLLRDEHDPGVAQCINDAILNYINTHLNLLNENSGEILENIRILYNSDVSPLYTQRDNFLTLLANHLELLSLEWEDIVGRPPIRGDVTAFTSEDQKTIFFAVLQRDPPPPIVNHTIIHALADLAIEHGEADDWSEELIDHLHAIFMQYVTGPAVYPAEVEAICATYSTLIDKQGAQPHNAEYFDNFFRELVIRYGHVHHVYELCTTYLESNLTDIQEATLNAIEGVVFHHDPHSIAFRQLLTDRRINFITAATAAEFARRLTTPEQWIIFFDKISTLDADEKEAILREVINSLRDVQIISALRALAQRQGTTDPRLTFGEMNTLAPDAIHVLLTKALGQINSFNELMEIISLYDDVVSLELYLSDFLSQLLNNAFKILERIQRDNPGEFVHAFYVIQARTSSQLATLGYAPAGHALILYLSARHDANTLIPVLHPEQREVLLLHQRSRAFFNDVPYADFLKNSGEAHAPHTQLMRERLHASIVYALEHTHLPPFFFSADISFDTAWNKIESLYRPGGMLEDYAAISRPSREIVLEKINTALLNTFHNQLMLIYQQFKQHDITHDVAQRETEILIDGYTARFKKTTDLSQYRNPETFPQRTQMYSGIFTTLGCGHRLRPITHWKNHIDETLKSLFTLPSLKRQDVFYEIEHLLTLGMSESDKHYLREKITPYLARFLNTPGLDGDYLRTFGVRLNRTQCAWQALRSSMIQSTVKDRLKPPAEVDTKRLDRIEQLNITIFENITHALMRTAEENQFKAYVASHLPEILNTGIPVATIQAIMRYRDLNAIRDAIYNDIDKRVDSLEEKQKHFEEFIDYLTHHHPAGLRALKAHLQNITLSHIEFCLYGVTLERINELAGTQHTSQDITNFIKTELRNATDLQNAGRGTAYFLPILRYARLLNDPEIDALISENLLSYLQAHRPVQIATLLHETRLTPTEIFTVLNENKVVLAGQYAALLADLNIAVSEATVNLYYNKFLDSADDRRAFNALTLAHRQAIIQAFMRELPLGLVALNDDGDELIIDPPDREENLKQIFKKITQDFTPAQQKINVNIIHADIERIKQTFEGLAAVNITQHLNVSVARVTAHEEEIARKRIARHLPPLADFNNLDWNNDELQLIATEENRSFYQTFDARLRAIEANLNGARLATENTLTLLREQLQAHREQLKPYIKKAADYLLSNEERAILRRALHSLYYKKYHADPADNHDLFILFCIEADNGFKHLAPEYQSLIHSEQHLACTLASSVAALNDIHQHLQKNKSLSFELISSVVQLEKTITTAEADHIAFMDGLADLRGKVEARKDLFADNFEAAHAIVQRHPHYRITPQVDLRRDATTGRYADEAKVEEQRQLSSSHLGATSDVPTAPNKIADGETHLVLSQRPVAPNATPGEMIIGRTDASVLYTQTQRLSTEGLNYATLTVIEQEQFVEQCYRDARTWFLAWCDEISSDRNRTVGLSGTVHEVCAPSANKFKFWSKEQDAKLQTAASERYARMLVHKFIVLMLAKEGIDFNTHNVIGDAARFSPQDENDFATQKFAEFEARFAEREAPHIPSTRLLAPDADWDVMSRALVP